MINKLLDEPYWHELPERIKESLGEYRFLSSSSTDKWRILSLLCGSWDNEEENENATEFSAEKVYEIVMSQLPGFRTKMISSMGWLSNQCLNVNSIEISEEDKEKLKNFLSNLEKINNIEEVFLIYKKMQELREIEWIGFADDLIENLTTQKTINSLLNLSLKRTGKLVDFKDISTGHTFFYGGNFWVKINSDTASELLGTSVRHINCCRFVGYDMDHKKMEEVEIFISESL